MPNRYRLGQQHAVSFIAHAEAGTGTELPRFIRPGRAHSRSVIEMIDLKTGAVKEHDR